MNQRRAFADTGSLFFSSSTFALRGVLMRE